ncbi:MAG: hypothetical protein E7337_16280 [Clostridiales bacterium]|nr:hypothetical protein [Clostridiales bacterium]
MNATQAEMKVLIAAISALRTPAIPGEYDIHQQIALALQQAQVDFTHEYRLGPRRRIDFRAGRIGIEVKKGRPVTSQLLTQLRKYLESEDLDGMIVVTQRAVNLPATIYGKPVYLLSLNRLWGVALP